MSFIESTQIERFFAKVRVCSHGSPCEHCCWVWLGSRDKKSGYGRTRYVFQDFEETYAHRVAWVLTHNKLASVLDICHSCANPSCCNPSHLWEGTAKANHEDSKRKNRKSCGRVARKLTAENVTGIRRDWFDGLSQRQIAVKYNVSQPLVSQILTHKVWVSI